VGSANTRYLINEIVLGEESDVDEHDNRISHFELYLKAMRQMGAPTNLIDALINEINNGHSIEQAIQLAPLPNKVKMFLLYTFEIAQNAPLYVKAAVFTFGREDLIPDMFTAILNKIYKDHPDQVATFKYYIERHIEVDGGHHSQLALEMVAELCGNDATKWEQATSASLKALEMRSLLWDAINENKS
jgi:HEPN domain-containing protein